MDLSTEERESLLINAKATHDAPVRLRIAARIAHVPEAQALALARKGRIRGAVPFGRDDYLLHVAALREAAGIPAPSPRLARRRRGEVRA